MGSNEFEIQKREHYIIIQVQYRYIALKLSAIYIYCTGAQRNIQILH